MENEVKQILLIKIITELIKECVRVKKMVWCVLEVGVS
jgi:hypothetical protein